MFGSKASTLLQGNYIHIFHLIVVHCVRQCAGLDGPLFDPAGFFLRSSYPTFNVGVYQGWELCSNC